MLPANIGDLVALEELLLTNNRLVRLPESVGQLAALQKAYLSENQIEELPSSVGNLTSLRTLHLRRNRLAVLPESFGMLPSLQDLVLSDNQLLALPWTFGQLGVCRNSCCAATGLPSSLAPSPSSHLSTDWSSRAIPCRSHRLMSVRRAFLQSRLISSSKGQERSAYSSVSRRRVPLALTCHQTFIDACLCSCMSSAACSLVHACSVRPHHVSPSSSAIRRMTAFCTATCQRFSRSAESVSCGKMT